MNCAFPVVVDGRLHATLSLTGDRRAALLSIRYDGDPLASSSDLIGDVGPTTTVVPVQSVAQVLVGKKNALCTRVLFEAGSPFSPKGLTVTFSDAAARDSFIAAVRQSSLKDEQQGQPLKEEMRSTDECATGAMSKEMIERLLTERESRGVVNVFEAINELIDANTLSLRPLTEQLEADIFRQLPELARKFHDTVHSDEERKCFWEDAVRQYFCFAGTAQPSGALTTARVQDNQEEPPHGDATLNHLFTMINQAGASALPVSSARPHSYATKRERHETEGEMFELLHHGSVVAKNTSKSQLLFQPFESIPLEERTPVERTMSLNCVLANGRIVSQAISR